MNTVELDHSISEAFSDEDVVAEFVSHLGFSEFYALYAKVPVNDRSLLDSEKVATRILASKDKGKALILAMFSQGGYWSSGLSPEQILQLAEISPEHKRAILSNVRISWYDTSPSMVRDKLIIPSILNAERKLDRFSLAIFKNPRIDRRLIADVIRGKEAFRDLPLRDRLWAAIYALQATEIKSEHYPGKDMPDSNELNFDRPTRAIFSVIREGLAEKHPVLQYLWEPAIRYFASHILTLEDDDWLSADDLEKTQSEDFQSRYKERHSLSRKRFIEWLTTVPPGEMNVSFEGKKEYSLFDDYNADLLVSQLVYRALWDKDPAPSLSSKDWRIRAGAYAAKFEKQAARVLYGGGATKFATQMLKEHRQDGVAALRGITLSQYFWRALEREKIHFDDFVLNAGLNLARDDIAFSSVHVQELVYPEFQEGEESNAADEVSIPNDGQAAKELIAVTVANARQIQSQIKSQQILLMTIAVLTALICWHLLA